MKRVLHIVGSMSPGGLENFIMNVYQHIDRTQVQFDIILHQRKENDYAKQIEAMGGRVYELPRLTKHPLKNLMSIYCIVKEGKYEFVFRHTANALIAPQLLAARLAGAKHTVCHAHSSNDPQLTAHKLGKILMKIAATDRIACSPKAGQWMYGKDKSEIVCNAIDLERFVYNEQAREKIRQEFHIAAECKVYGHVGNFSDVKNHKYLLKIFYEIAKIDDKARFFLLGDGGLRQEIEAQRKELGLEEKVMMPGLRKDVDAFFSCLDVLIFPSKFEGLPLTLIESQAAGIPSIISTGVIRSVEVTTGLMHFYSIEEEPALWAKKATALAGSIERTCHDEELKKAGYDIHTLAKWYEEMILRR